MDKVTFLFGDITVGVPIGGGCKKDWDAIDMARARLEAVGFMMGSFCGKVVWDRQVCGDYSLFMEKDDKDDE